MQSAAWHRWALQPYPTRATRVNGIMQLHYCKSVQSLQITALQIHFENTAEDQECFYSCSAVMKFYLKPAGPPYLGCISAFPSVGTNRSVQVLSTKQLRWLILFRVSLWGEGGEKDVFIIGPPSYPGILTHETRLRLKEVPVLQENDAVSEPGWAAHGFQNRCAIMQHNYCLVIGRPWRRWQFN